MNLRVPCSSFLFRSATMLLTGAVEYLMAGSSGDPMKVPARCASTAARIPAKRKRQSPTARRDLHIGACARSSASTVLPSSLARRRVETEQPDRVSLQNPVPVDSRQLELLDHRAGVLDVSGIEAVGADDDAIRSDEVEEEAKPFGVIGEIVVMESPHIGLERVLQLRLIAAHVIPEMFEPPRNVRECAPGMRQHDFKLRIFVERAGADEFRREDRVGKRVVETVVGRSSSEEIRIQIVKQDRVSQLLDARQQRRKLRLEEVIAIVNRVGQVNGAQAGLPCNPIQFL